MAKARIPVPGLKGPLAVLNLTAAVAAGITKAGKDSLLVQRGSKSLQGSLGTAQLRQMGDYGYTVDDSPRPPKAKV